MNGRPLRVGIAGCGIGKHHADAYAKLDDVRLVALADLCPQLREALASEHGVRRVYSDYRELVADEEVQAVSICLPNHLHVPASLAALAAGKHVLCEKPLAMSSGEAQRIVDEAHRRGLTLAVGFKHRCRTDVGAVRQAVAEGQLGEIYYLKAGWMRRAGVPGIGSWFTNQALSGGGSLIDLGVHVLDMALYVLGYPRWLTASASTYAKFGPRGEGGFIGARFANVPGGKCDVEDLATAFIRLEGGVTLTLEASWASYSTYGDDFYLQVMGDRGGADLMVRSYGLTDTLRFIGSVAGYPAISRPLGSQHARHEGLIRDFVEAVLQHREPQATGEQGVTCMEMVEAIYRSAREGREVSHTEVLASELVGSVR